MNSEIWLCIEKVLGISRCPFKDSTSFWMTFSITLWKIEDWLMEFIYMPLSLIFKNRVKYMDFLNFFFFFLRHGIFVNT
jgi:hypothetical protein